MTCECNKRNGNGNSENGKLKVKIPERGRKGIIPEKQTEHIQKRSSHKEQPKDQKKKPQ
jgi:hypothetical protein